MQARSSCDRNHAKAVAHYRRRASLTVRDVHATATQPRDGEGELAPACWLAFVRFRTGQRNSLHHVISIGALLAKAKGSDSPVAEDTFGDVATAVLAVATAGLLFAAIWAGKSAKASVGVAAKGIQDQINEQRLIERRRRTYELLSAYYAPDFAENVGEARPLANALQERCVGRRRPLEGNDPSPAGDSHLGA